MGGIISEKQISEYLITDMSKNSSLSRYRHTYKADLTNAFVSYCGMRWVTMSKPMENYVSDLIKTVTKDSPELMNDPEKIKFMKETKYNFLGVIPVKFLISEGIPEKIVYSYSGYDPPDDHIRIFETSLSVRHPDRELPVELTVLWGKNRPQKQLYPVEYPDPGMKGPFEYLNRIPINTDLGDGLRIENGKVRGGVVE